MSLKNIIQGWGNRLTPESKRNQFVEAVAASRMRICSGCPHNSENTGQATIRPDEYCTKCGCTLSAKTRSLSSSCPVNKWDSVSE